MGTTTDIGNRAEQAAADYLSGRGFDILHRNWRSGRYELDIVARKDGTIHFVEVKCRKRRGLTTPQDAITPAKFRALVRAAEAYIEEYGIELEPQFDLVAAEHDGGGIEINYIPNAMTPSW